jgi:hypothetical protein
MSGALCDLGELGKARYALISKPHRLKPPPLHISKLKKEKDFFFFFLVPIILMGMRIAKL